MFKNYSFKKIRYALEAPITWLGMIFFRILPLNLASDFSANIAKFVGKKIAVNRLAFDNLSKALPLLTKDEKIQIIDGMWDNLGRIIGEFPHVCAMTYQELKGFVEIDEESQKNIDEIKKLNRGGIIFSAHFGNWEIGPKILLNQGLKVNTVYRPLNNPFVEKLTAKKRGVPMIKKGASGSRQLVSALKNREFIIIMADQKVTDGALVKFFNDDAVTATSIAKIAIKYEVPLIPGCIFRNNKKFNFSLKIDKPLEYKLGDISDMSVLRATLKINQKIQEWITKSPEQWFWVHNRWKK
ncbi:MAG: hypothetical protein FJX30_06100 [Alphaproteobacteria bacterium]|nr:hypothetical protein [Alphaproteobacteria bacterium]